MCTKSHHMSQKGHGHLNARITRKLTIRCRFYNSFWLCLYGKEFSKCRYCVGFGGCDFSYYLSVTFRPWSKMSRSDNAIDNTQKIHPVMALGKFSTMKSQPKTNVKPTTNCRFPSGACVYVTVTFL